jgi:hypothetical protein
VQLTGGFLPVASRRDFFGVSAPGWQKFHPLVEMARLAFA